MNERLNSIFREYYADKPFVDLFAAEPAVAVDVIIPVIHTNELWETNLLSFYREIPIRKLLIGDGGCIDDSMDIVKKFPRVQIFDHKEFVSLGYSLRKLIEAIETEWFIYLHSDVYLPPGWFNAMRSYQNKYDWFECNQRTTLLVEHDLDYSNYTRPLSGAQMGRVSAFEKVLPNIDDDYLYRNEDIVLAELVKRSGFRYGRADNTFHYHQTLRKPTPWSRKVKSVQIEVELSREEEVRTCMTWAKGIVKYLAPPLLSQSVIQNVNRLQELDELTWKDFYDWVKTENPAWLPILRQQGTGDFLKRLKTFLRAAYRLVLP